MFLNARVYPLIPSADQGQLLFVRQFPRQFLRSLLGFAQPGSSFVTVFIKISSNVSFFLFCGFIIAQIYDKIKS